MWKPSCLDLYQVSHLQKSPCSPSHTFSWRNLATLVPLASAGSRLVLGCGNVLLLFGDNGMGLLGNLVDVTELAEWPSGTKWQVFLVFGALHDQSSGDGSDARGGVAAELYAALVVFNPATSRASEEVDCLLAANWVLRGGRHL